MSYHMPHTFYVCKGDRRPYFSNFIKTGNPNGGTLPVWSNASLNPVKIRRQVIDVVTYGAAFHDQTRYEAAESLLYMH